MKIKNLFKITPLRFLSFVVLYIVLWVGHIWCMPMMVSGGAIMPNGEVGGGLDSRCGFFSQWIWDNHSVFNFYNKINSWHILLIVLIIILLYNLIVEIINSKKNLNANKEIKKHIIPQPIAYTLIVIAVLLLFIFFLTSLL